ncbi:hypothetical protein [Natronolimnobius aegyptiacus]|uniref:Uncharacterized protein n=1 Tax=Natrarchaeobaculum aegyptiacum TaxID=745377 RepID=A0A2Z2HWV4_9EURY|nr:hypothetical protein B1756_13630 [Natrarchaeobaculum aegyptiacum]
MERPTRDEPADRGTDGGPTTLSCPICASTVPAGLPYSATVVALETEFLDGSDRPRTTSRIRRIQVRCVRSHPLTVWYDW